MSRTHPIGATTIQALASEPMIRHQMSTASPADANGQVASAAPAGEDMLVPRQICTSNGLVVTVLPYGARIQSITWLGQELTLSVADPAFYLSDSAYLGATVGRYANRIAHACFTDSQGTSWPLSANQAPHCLHGGASSLANLPWTVIAHQPNALRLAITSPHGDQGFPGNLSVQLQLTVVETLDSRGQPAAELQLQFSAQTDRETVLNLTNHCYFNLAASQTPATLAAHQLQIHADHYLAVDPAGIPLSDAMVAVDAGHFDFRHPRPLEALCQPTPSGPHGLDHCFVLAPALGHATAAQTPNVSAPSVGASSVGASSVGESFRAPALPTSPPLCATLSYQTPQCTRQLEVRSTLPGLQVYVGSYLSAPFEPFQAICLEAQHWPDAPNRPDFPSPWLHPGERYQQSIFYRFS